jgi:hypothetical protein
MATAVPDRAVDYHRAAKREMLRHRAAEFGRLATAAPPSQRFIAERLAQAAADMDAKLLELEGY